MGPNFVSLTLNLYFSILLNTSTIMDNVPKISTNKTLSLLHYSFSVLLSLSFLLLLLSLFSFCFFSYLLNSLPLHFNFVFSFFSSLIILFFSSILFNLSNFSILLFSFVLTLSTILLFQSLNFAYYIFLFLYH